ncbi:MmcQ/YjbR family DNA-binding protein [Bacillus sp. JJ1764]|uniref:MmcQ/YjbR family DNA-binding protein n=1 Tax=Bacillus sp. JJ1764 TaxID=3122964 RepID=UPI002FFFB619
MAFINPMKMQNSMNLPEVSSNLENVRRICLSLPDAVEIVDGHGHITFKINGKSFVIIGAREENSFNLSFKSDRETQELLLQKEHFYKTPYIGRYGWVSIQNPKENDWNELSELIQEAYLRAAPKRLVKKWKDSHPK